MCAAIVLKHRFAKMSLVQRILSMILYASIVESGFVIFML